MKDLNWKRNVFVLAFSAGCTSAGYTMLIPFLPMYLLDLGVATENVAIWSGVVFSITFFVAAVMAPLWGKLADKKGKKLKSEPSNLTPARPSLKKPAVLNCGEIMKVPVRSI